MQDTRRDSGSLPVSSLTRPVVLGPGLQGNSWSLSVSEFKRPEVDGIRAAEVMLSDFHSLGDAWENRMSGQ